MQRKQKLELTWIGKENRPRLEPRILLEESDRSYHAKARVTDHDIFDNRLIYGDNLIALKALEQEFAGKVKCVFIDPPYNTGSAFAQYDDGVEHSMWLSLMRDRLELIRRLLSDDGSLWITIDDNEAHYLKVLCDEIFGRSSFVANAVWQKRTSRENRAAIGSSHDHLLIYAKSTPGIWKNFRNLLPANDSGYANPDNDSRVGRGDQFLSVRKDTDPTRCTRSRLHPEIFYPPKGRCWGATEVVFKEYLRENRVYFPNGGIGRPRIKQFAGEENGLVPMTWWTAEFAGDNEAAKKEILELFPDDEVFVTPKPERLIEKIILIATNKNDIVLDSFAGSGTTGAVAHKMNRRWIMVELGKHCQTYILPRLTKVINGEDEGGITKIVNWKGGGGFRYFRIAPSLLDKDKFGNWIISKQYNAAMLSEAMCKLESFTYAPSETEYWNQGHSTEEDFIYVTTQTLNREQLEKLSDEVGEKRSLLVCCSAFRVKDLTQFPNLTVKKIPKMVLNRCEWGHDDYSLEIQNLPSPPPEMAVTHEPAVSLRSGRKTKDNASLSLFAAVSETEGQD